MTGNAKNFSAAVVVKNLLGGKAEIWQPEPGLKYP